MKTKTGWYSGDQKPVRVGLYEREYDDRHSRSVPDYFDGKKWWIGIGLGKIAHDHGRSMRWRGLTERAK